MEKMLNILPIAAFKDMIGYTTKVFAMLLKISCPNCNQLVASNARFCPNCGVDLALAAALAEHDVLAHTVIPQSLPSLAPEALVPRVGETMIERGILTPEQLHRALDYQHNSSLRASRAYGSDPDRYVWSTVDALISNHSSDQPVATSSSRLQSQTGTTSY